jgi:hypothetical protein
MIESKNTPSMHFTPAHMGPANFTLMRKIYSLLFQGQNFANELWEQEVPFQLNTRKEME